MYWKHLGLSIILASAGFFPVPYHALAQDPLTVANVRASAVDDQSATIQWSTNHAARGKVEYGKSASYGQSYGFEGEPRISQSITLPNLTADTVYHFRVIANTSFEEARSFDQTFTTAKAIDRDTPIVTDVAIPYQLSNLVVIQWRTSEPADSQVLFGPNTRYGRQAGDSALVTVHDITITGLQPLTTYHFQVKSKDNGNNVGLSTDYTFRTASDSSSRSSLELVNVRPVAANDPAITDTSAEISWRTNTLADGLVRWGTTDGLGLSVQSPPPRDFFHTAKLVNLQPATTYYFQVESKDVFGVSVRSPIFTFATKGGFGTYTTSPTGRALRTSTGYDLMFYNSFDHGLNADFALGDSTANITGSIRVDIKGIRGGAAQFNDGSRLTYQVPRNLNLEQGTIAFWIKPDWDPNDSLSRELFIIDPDVFQSTGHSFAVEEYGQLTSGKDYPRGQEDYQSVSHTLAFFLTDNQHVYHLVLPSQSLRPSQWQFITITWQYFGGTPQLYLNGSSANVQTKVDSHDANSPIILGPPAAELGQHFVIAPVLALGTTKMDEITFFGRPLSGDEVNILYTHGVSRWLPKQSAAPTIPATAQVLGASTLQYTPTTALLRAKGEPDVYAIMSGQKHLISGPSSFAAYGYRWSDVHVVSRDVLEKIPDARLVRTPTDPAVYYLYLREQRQWLKLGIPSPTVFVSYPNNFWGNIITINEIDLANYPNVRLIRGDDSQTVYLLENGAKREITSEAVYDELKLPRSNVAVVNRVNLDFYPNGEPLTAH